MIKKLLIGLVAVALSACTPVVTAEAPAKPYATAGAASCGIAAGTLLDEKTLYLAETAYNVPANAYVTADAEGLLTPTTKDRVKPMLLKAYDALQLARSAYRAGSACEFVDAVRNVTMFANQAKAILPQPK